MKHAPQTLLILAALALSACGGSIPHGPAEPEPSAVVDSKLVARIRGEIDLALADRHDGMDDRAAARLRALLVDGRGLLDSPSGPKEKEEVAVALTEAWLVLAGIHATYGDVEGRINALSQAVAFGDGTRVEAETRAMFFTEQAALGLRQEIPDFAAIASNLGEAERLSASIPKEEQALSARSQVLNVRTRALLEFAYKIGPTLETAPLAALPAQWLRYTRVTLRAEPLPLNAEEFAAPLVQAEIDWLVAKKPLTPALLREALRLNAEMVALDQRRFASMANRDASRALEVAKDVAQEADIREMLGDKTGALQKARQALATFDQQDMFEDAVIERIRIVRLLAESDPGAALQMSTGLVAQVEAKTGALSGRSMPSFLDQFGEAYARHSQLLFDAYEKAQGSESARFLEQLVLHADRSNFRATRRDFTLYRALGERIAETPKVKELLDRERAKLAVLAQEVDRAIAAGKGPEDESFHPVPGISIDDPFEGLKQEKIAFVELLEDLKRQMLDATTTRSGLVTSLGEVREGMTREDAVVFYFRDPGDNGSLRAAVIGGDGSLRLVKLIGTRDVTKELVKKAHDAIALAEVAPTAFRDLAEAVWWPLGSLPKNLTVVLSPELAGIPFEALPGKGGRAAVLDHTFRYTFGLSRGAGARRSARAVRTALVAGAERYGTHDLEPLASGLEVAEVRKQLVDAGASVAPSVALPESGRGLFSGAGHYDLLLLSTHSILDGSVPMADLLAFPEDDVDAWSLAVSQVRSEIVILSACELMRERGKEQDPVSGIATASLARISPRLMGGLWNVNEEAARTFISRLTARLIKGEQPEDALAAVKRELLQGSSGSLRGELKAPYYWAPFVLTIGAGG